MTKRGNIIEGSSVTKDTKYGMVYTCQCGWVDVGHANPFNKNPNIGAANLWNTINKETGPRSPNGLWHKVTSIQSMPAIPLGLGSVSKSYAVRLAWPEMKRSPSRYPFSWLFRSTSRICRAAIFSPVLSRPKICHRTSSVFIGRSAEAILFRVCNRYPKRLLKKSGIPTEGRPTRNIKTGDSFVSLRRVPRQAGNLVLGRDAHRAVENQTTYVPI